MDLTSFIALGASGLAVAFIHAAIPTHWLPFIVVARAQGWSRGRTLLLVDNLDSVAEAAGPILVGWLTDATEAAFLVTSRVTTRARPERVSPGGWRDSRSCSEPAREAPEGALPLAKAAR